MLSAVAQKSETSLDEVKFHNNFFNVTKFSKEWKIWPKTYFLIFVLFVGKFSNKHHYNLLMSWPSSGPAIRVVWPWKRPASGWRSFWELSSFVPWLLPNALRVGSGVVPEYPGSNGFIKKSSNCASAPRMRFSVLLNSFDSLFVTLPSISLETWVM